MIKFKFLKLVVDIGNTCTKLALFDKKRLTKHEIIPKLSLEKTIKFCGDNKIESSIFSSVVSLYESDYQIINFFDGPGFQEYVYGNPEALTKKTSENEIVKVNEEALGVEKKSIGF